MMARRRNLRTAGEWQSSGGGSHAQIASSAVTEDRQRLHRRVVAAVALALLFAGLLMALSLVLVGLAILALTVVVLLGAGTVSLVRRVDTRPALEFMATSTATASRAGRRRGARLRGWTAGAPRRTRGVTKRAFDRTAGIRGWTAGAPRRTRGVTKRAFDRTAGVRGWTADAPRRTRGFATGAFDRSVSGMYRVGLIKRQSLDPRERAHALNQRGARLRREGNAEEAAEQHRAALDIVRDLGDQRAEALTLNNLGLALAHTGAERAALEYLEQAVGVLRELGDEEHEGQAIANLGLVYRRWGQGDEAATLFQEALEKLPPASPAYRQVEEELRRAG